MLYLISVSSLKLRPRLPKDCKWQEEMKYQSSEKADKICSEGCVLCAGAWRSMEVHGRQTLVVPQLVTGCKIWHLRPEGSFYPKAAWRTAVDGLPEGSQVSMLLACSQHMQLRQRTMFGNHGYIALHGHQD